MKSSPLKTEEFVQMTKFTLNIFESLVSVVLISTLYVEKLSDVTQPIRLLSISFQIRATERDKSQAI